MTEILLKGRKTLTHPSIHPQTQPSRSISLHVGLALFTLELVFLLDYKNYMLETKELELEL